MKPITQGLLVAVLVFASVSAMGLEVTFDSRALLTGKDDAHLGLGLFTVTGDGLKEGEIWQEKDVGLNTRTIVLDEWMVIRAVGVTIGAFKVEWDNGYVVTFREDCADRMANNFDIKLEGEQLTLTLQTQRVELNMNGYQCGWFMSDMSYQNAGNWVFHMPMDFTDVCLSTPGNDFLISVVSGQFEVVNPGTGALLVAGDGEIYFDGLVGLPVWDNTIQSVQLTTGHFGYGDAIALGDSVFWVLPGEYPLFSWPATKGDPGRWYVNGVQTNILTIPAVISDDWYLDIYCIGADDGVRYSMTLGNPPIPEPATMSLLALGGLALLRRRK